MSWSLLAKCLAQRGIDPALAHRWQVLFECLCLNLQAMLMLGDVSHALTHNEGYRLLCLS